MGLFFIIGDFEVLLNKYFSNAHEDSYVIFQYLYCLVFYIYQMNKSTSYLQLIWGMVIGRTTWTSQWPHMHIQLIQSISLSYPACHLDHNHHLGFFTLRRALLELFWQNLLHIPVSQLIAAKGKQKQND